MLHVLAYLAYHQVESIEHCHHHTTLARVMRYPISSMLS